MGRQRKYSDEDRATALAALDANSGDYLKTSKMLHIPRTTLIEWDKGRVHPVVSAIRQEKKGDLAARLEELAGLLVDDLTSAETRRAASFSQLATGLGIAVDKMRLLRGESTENIALNMSAEIKGAAASELDEWRQRQQENLLNTSSALQTPPTS